MLKDITVISDKGFGLINIEVVGGGCIASYQSSLASMKIPLVA
jgi:hypothetical protein